MAFRLRPLLCLLLATAAGMLRLLCELRVHCCCEEALFFATNTANSPLQFETRCQGRSSIAPQRALYSTAKYAKMLKAGVCDNAVRQKMILDGVPLLEITAFLGAGDVT